MYLNGIKDHRRTAAVQSGLVWLVSAPTASRWLCSTTVSGNNHHLKVSCDFIIFISARV